MDPRNPFLALASGVEADVLQVLFGSGVPLTGRRVHQLAGRSYAQVREVLHRLVGQGVVVAERHGQAVSYSVNRSHVLAAPLAEIARSTSSVHASITAELVGWMPPLAALVLFGSFARGDGTADSDLDLLVVRADAVDADDEAWTDQLLRLARRVEAITGNRVQLVELTESELRQAVRSDQPLVASIRADGIALHGPPVRDLLRGE